MSSSSSATWGCCWKWPGVQARWELQSDICPSQCDSCVHLFTAQERWTAVREASGGWKRFSRYKEIFTLLKIFASVTFVLTVRLTADTNTLTGTAELLGPSLMNPTDWSLEEPRLQRHAHGQGETKESEEAWSHEGEGHREGSDSDKCFQVLSQSLSWSLFPC